LAQGFEQLAEIEGFTSDHDELPVEKNAAILAFDDALLRLETQRA